MDANNKRKNELLGMSFGSAAHRLRKSIMFQMAQSLGRDNCFRCGDRIESVDDLSIEHKESWRLSTNPRESFFDLNNIAFSHLSCNSSAGDRSAQARHGRGRYNSGKCRCEECRAANARHKRERLTRKHGRRV